MSGRGRANDRDTLMEQGQGDARRNKQGHHIGLWILAAVAAALALAALIWVGVHSHRQADPHSHLCRPVIKQYTVVEFDDILFPENTPTLGAIQAIAGRIVDNATDDQIGNTTGSCVTADVYVIEETVDDEPVDVTYYMQTCTQVYNLFASPSNETIVGGFVATGNFLANTANGTYINGQWAITGGFGSLLGANGQSSVDVVGSSELEGYLESWIMSVPCNIVAA